MKVKKYEGTGIKEIVERIKMDLGPEATILFMKEFTRRKFLRRGERHLEVIAGVEEKDSAFDAGKLEMIHAELQELKSSVENIPQGISESFSSKDAVLRPQVREIKETLCEAQVEEDYAISILKEFQERFTEKELSSAPYREENLIRHLSRYLKSSGSIRAMNNKIVAFVGPTGVGKTTTIAKLAAKFSLVERKRVSLITVDTYRIAAVDQLKTYAEIIGIPIEVVFNTNELLVSLNKNKDKDLIFIDTAGSNPFDSVRMGELKKFFGKNPNIERHLLVSLTTRARELVEIFNCYNVMEVHKVIFTKLDEATGYGDLLNFSMKVNKPVSYITTGQNVPDDIETADSLQLARFIVKGRDMLSSEKEPEKISKYR